MRHRVIVADPPWSYAHRHGGSGLSGTWGNPARQYPTMTIDAIRRLPVVDLAERDSALFLWVTNGLLPEAFPIMEAWGFRYVTLITWCKPIGLGLGFRSSTEHCLFGRRGDLRWRGGTNIPNRFDWPKAKHSQKPEAFYDLVEEVFPGPYLELFARRQRLGWDYWGNEVDSTISVGEGALSCRT